MEKISLTIENGQPIVKEMESKLPISQNEDGEIIVSGRNLHDFLEVESKYQDWIKRMIEYGFNFGVDYAITTELSQKKEGSRLVTRELKDHAMRLDMAKEISMLQRNEKGRQARKYFIAVEKKLKEVIEDPYEGLSPELKAVFVLDKKTQQIEEKVNNLESNMPLFNVECKELQALVRKAGIRVLGGYRTPAYKDNSLRGKVYADIQGQLKRQFGVNRYEAIKRSQLDTAKEILENYTVPIYLQDQIINVNNQVSF
ncbi:hypothetical protein EXN54_19510 [Clostridium botulinum]|uniref:ORF6C domain-containing protein n=1 Tax=Clostridium botulinum TaxID=1491 RepID=UPI0007739084|nr:ORF6C domain-containing protein [Clostridium botulinum]MBN3403563.1 hypothetical protein [Clostridium botulinum]NEZ84040.1 hypothetical protein [Clostridium botulinum]NFA07301.1 hypothetical protein [Clostridium botulinum]NFA25942.1 hypothetical protein [Clostridium botulinum]NFB80828.1 hypothetical protein [Clostridium botulinum]